MPVFIFIFYFSEEVMLELELIGRRFSSLLIFTHCFNVQKLLFKSNPKKKSSKNKAVLADV